MPEKPPAVNARREVLRKAVYVAPLLLSFPVLPAFAAAGSRSSPPAGRRRPRPRRRRRFGG
jgi:hypothetical protein